MNERIAVAFDFSSRSELALIEAIAIARGAGAEVHLIHVCEGPIASGDTGLAKLEDAMGLDAREQLARAHARFDGQGALIFQTIVDGDPAEALRNTAVELRCTTIAIGTHGRTGLRRFFLGSVAEKVVRTAPMDVLVARGTRRSAGYRRILVPTDFSPAADRALTRAVALAAPKASIELFHVWRLPGQLSLQYATASAHKAAVDRIVSRIRDEARERANERIGRIERADVDVVFADFNGSEGSAILDRAAGCDLVAIGTHGRLGMERVALGSIAERTLRRASCSVLATHAPDTE